MDSFSGWDLCKRRWAWGGAGGRKEEEKIRGRREERHLKISTISIQEP